MQALGHRPGSPISHAGPLGLRGLHLVFDWTYLGLFRNIVFGSRLVCWGNVHIAKKSLSSLPPLSIRDALHSALRSANAIFDIFMRIFKWRDDRGRLMLGL